MTRALLDTSILIAEDVDPAGADRPTTAAISVVTLGELRAGVLLARHDGVRAARQARLLAVRTRLAPLPVDEAVAEH